MIPDPIAPARGCSFGSCLGCLCWVAIFAAIGIFAAIAVLAGAWA
jgi:hypothetical protein